MCPLQVNLEVGYCDAEAEDACVLDGTTVGWLNDAERLTAEALLLHPSERTREQEFQLQVSALTSQAPSGRKRKSRQEFRREIRAAVWKEALGNKTVSHRLRQVNPEVSKTKGSNNKKQVSAAKNTKHGKRPGGGDGTFNRKWRRRKRKQQRLKAAAAAAALAATDGPEDGPLCNQQVYIL